MVSFTEPKKYFQTASIDDVTFRLFACWSRWTNCTVGNSIHFRSYHVVSPEAIQYSRHENHENENIYTSSRPVVFGFGFAERSTVWALSFIQNPPRDKFGRKVPDPKSETQQKPFDFHPQKGVLYRIQ